MENIGRYELLEEIGQGGMAVVYRAHDTRLKRDVALKLLASHLESKEPVMARFEQEARIVANLEHPHIVPIYDFGVHEERPYLVMRLLRGGTFRARSADLARSQAALWSFGMQVAAALDDAHAHGIVHRDVKPSNILFDNHDLAYVADFGVAKILHATTRITKQHRIIGTPAYMSPEQCGEQEVDGRSDQYSLAIVLFEALAGQLPFTGDTLQIMYKHTHEPPPAVHALNKSLPAGLTPVFRRALAKEPADRYPDVTAFITALQQASKIDAQQGPKAGRAPGKAAGAEATTHVEPPNPHYEAGMAAMARGSWRIAMMEFERVGSSDPYYGRAISERRKARRRLAEARPKPRPAPSPAPTPAPNGGEAPKPIAAWRRRRFWIGVVVALLLLGLVILLVLVNQAAAAAVAGVTTFAAPIPALARQPMYENNPSNPCNPWPIYTGDAARTARQPTYKNNPSNPCNPWPIYTGDSTRLRRTSKRMKICSANIPVCVVKQGCLTYIIHGGTTFNVR